MGNLLVERRAVGDHLGLAHSRVEVQLEVALLEVGALDDEALVQGIPLCTGTLPQCL